MQGKGFSLDISNSCAKINVGLQTTNKKHRRSKMDKNSLAHAKWDYKTMWYLPPNIIGR